MKFKKLMMMAIVVGLAFSQCIGSMQIYAREEDALEDLKEREKYDEADSWRYSPYGVNSLADSGTTRSTKVWRKINGVIYNSEGQPINGARRVGVDVSVWNGTIDWEAAKKDGVEFAIIRCGWGGDITQYDDKQFFRNVSECTRLGIPFGIYLYSYSYDVTGAIDEANHVLRLLKGVSPSLPVYYDLEENGVRNTVSKTNIAKIAKTFCDKVSAAGYKTGVYSNLDWFTNYLTSPVFDNYDRWCAQWNSQCTYKGNYSVWQCSSKGSINGIASDVDLNIDFKLDDYVYKWILEDNAWYFYEYKDTRKTGWLHYKDNWYYLDESDGSMLADELREINGCLYYFDLNGKMVSNSWACINNQWYYFDKSGSPVSGWNKINNIWYYFDENIMLENAVMYIDDAYYGFNSKGAMLRNGWSKINGNWHYFASNGKAQLGWKYIQNNWYYLNTDSSMACNEWVDSYYVGGNGAMKTGWLQLNTNWYYLNDDLQVDGWRYINNKWYYFDAQGIMQTGMIQDDTGNTYYLSVNGDMGTGWKYINNNWYYFKSDMKTEWQFINGQWYYFDEYGIMANNCTLILEEFTYSFDENGHYTMLDD